MGTASAVTIGGSASPVATCSPVATPAGLSGCQPDARAAASSSAVIAAGSTSDSASAAAIGGTIDAATATGAASIVASGAPSVTPSETPIATGSGAGCCDSPLPGTLPSPSRSFRHASAIDCAHVAPLATHSRHHKPSQSIN